MIVFRVLGPVRLGTEMLAPKQRAVLAALLLRANQWVPVSYLVDAVWETPPRSAHGNLRTYVWQLRRALAAVAGPRRLDSTPGRYRLNVHQGELDRHVFADLVARAHQALAEGEAQAAVDAVAAALALWAGDPFEDVVTPLVAPEVTALREQRWAALECRAEARLLLGEAQSAIVELGPFLVEQPFRERLWALYMRALVQLGRRADALAAHRQIGRLLRDELGLAPGPELEAAHQLILAQRPGQ